MVESNNGSFFSSIRYANSFVQYLLFRWPMLSIIFASLICMLSLLSTIQYLAQNFSHLNIIRILCRQNLGSYFLFLAWDLSDIEDIECLGITDGIIGRVEHSNIYEPRLMIIKESVPVGQIYFHHTIYKIKSICFLNMGTTNQEIELFPCTKHGSSSNVSSSSRLINKKASRLFENSAFLNKTVGAVKNVSNTIKTTTQQAATQVCIAEKFNT